MRIPVGITDFISTETSPSCLEVDVAVQRSFVNCYLKDPDPAITIRLTMMEDIRIIIDEDSSDPGAEINKCKV